MKRLLRRIRQRGYVTHDPTRLVRVVKQVGQLKRRATGLAVQPHSRPRQARWGLARKHVVALAFQPGSPSGRAGWGPGRRRQRAGYVLLLFVTLFLALLGLARW